MAAKKQTEDVVKTVTSLVDVDVEYVSLVEHSANRTPFRIIKKDKGGDGVIRVIQSIMTKDESYLGDGWLVDVNREKREKRDGYVMYTQIDKGAFKQDTLKFEQAGEGVWALTGELKKDAPVDKSMVIQKSVMDVVVETEIETYEKSFGSVFSNEIWKLEEILYGLLTQRVSDPKKRKQSVLQAVDNFKAFLSSGLDIAGGQPIEKQERKGKMSFEFETQEEFAKAVSDIVTAAVKKMQKLDEEDALNAPATDTNEVEKSDGADVKAEEKEKSEAEKKQTGVDTTSIMGAITSLSKAVEELKKKTDDMGNQLVAEPAVSSSEEEEATPVKKSAKSIFAGLLTR